MRSSIVLCLALCAPPLAAQDHAHDDVSRPVILSEARDRSPHLRLTPVRVPTAADSARGDSLVRVARQAVSRYESVEAAEQDGYKVRLKAMKQAKVLHYTSLANGFAARTSFDPARPTSLLYERDGDGQLQLIGVMYTVPAGATLEELDARVPLGLVQWHLHTNICLPKGKDVAERRELCRPEREVRPPRQHQHRGGVHRGRRPFPRAVVRVDGARECHVSRSLGSRPEAHALTRSVIARRARSG